MLVSFVCWLELDIEFMVIGILLKLAHTDMELIEIFSHIYNFINHWYQLFVCTLHPVVHIAQYEIIISNNIRINFFSLDAHLFDKFTHHFITFFETFSSMYQVNIYHIEEVVVEFER